MYYGFPDFILKYSKIAKLKNIDLSIKYANP